MLTSTVLLLGSCAQSENAELAQPVTGEWIEVYPRGGRGISLVLNPDSTAAGNFTDTHIGGDSIPVSRWQLGAWAMPGGLCLGFGEQFSCQGYALRGDTLFLADPSRTALVRRERFDASRPYDPRAPRSLSPVPGAKAEP